MKILADVNVNNRGGQDAIIDYWMRPKKNQQGEILYIDEKSSIAKVNGHVNSVTIYLTDGNPSNNVQSITISGYSIKELYKQIEELEKLEGEEFVD